MAWEREHDELLSLRHLRNRHRKLFTVLYLPVESEFTKTNGVALHLDSSCMKTASEPPGLSRHQESVHSVSFPNQPSPANCLQPQQTPSPPLSYHFSESCLFAEVSIKARIQGRLWNSTHSLGSSLTRKVHMNINSPFCYFFGRRVYSNYKHMAILSSL